MAIVLVHDVSAAGPELVDAMRQAGLLDRIKSAPGFKGHWSGTTDTGYRVVEIWDSQEDWQAWFDGTVAPNTPPDVKADPPVFTELLVEIQPG